MRFRYLLLALLGLVALLVAPAPAVEEKVDTDKIEMLIKTLGSDAFSERDKATRALEAIGSPALEALRKATKSPDAEIRKRASTLLERIEQRAESARHLAPTMVHLKYKDVTLEEALLDFRKQSGYNLVIQDPEGKLKGARIHLDTGKVSFWNALEQFCAKAGLMEADPARGLVPIALRIGLPGAPPPGGAPAPPVPAPAANPVPIKRVPINPAPNPGAPLQGVAPGAAPAPVKVIGVQIEVKPIAPGAPAAVPAVPPGAVPAVPALGAFGGSAAVVRPTQPGQITLVPGKAPPIPADISSAIRVQALPDSKMYGASTDKEIVLPLRITAEPKLLLQRSIGLRLDKARDDQGQNLEASDGPRADGPVSSVVLPGGGWVQPAIGRLPYSGPSNHYQVVRLKKGAKASKVLEELSGTLSVEILTAAQPFLEVPDVLKAAGKEFKGKEGGRLEILSVETTAAGQTIIRYELEMPPGVTPDFAPLNAVPPALNKPGIVPLAPAKGAGGGFVPGAAPVAPAVEKKGEEKKEAEKGPAGKIEKKPVPAGGGGIAIAIAVPAGGVARPAFVGNPNGVTLRDDKNNILPTSVQVMGGKVNAGKFVVTHSMTYTPQKDHGSPTKLVFSGRKTATINVPFAIKDITLPLAR